MTEGESMITNVLAERYASSQMRDIWSRKSKIRMERQFWITVMKEQVHLGVVISSDEIAQYESKIDQIDLRSIDERERILRHDVKARIEEFNTLAGLERVHLGMTSRDLTENIELLQVKNSLILVHSKTIEILKLLSRRMSQHASLLMVGRTHNVAAQITTFGKRLASLAEELLFAQERLEFLIERLPFKGLRGPTGTGQDLEDLIGHESNDLERRVSESLGFVRTLRSTGQIYPRSIDFETISTLVQLSAAPSNFAILVRLMSGLGLMSEGFEKGQVGSSAMPHKVNARSSERINGLCIVLKGHLSMMSELSGAQWNEGDVTCSVVRRVALPDAFFVMDGILQTTHNVLLNMELFENVIDSEVQNTLPFLVTTKLLMEAIKSGMGREAAHKVIQEHSLSLVEKRSKNEEFDFFSSLAADSRFPLNRESINEIVDKFAAPTSLFDHINSVQTRISELTKKHQSITSVFESII